MLDVLVRATFVVRAIFAPAAFAAMLAATAGLAQAQTGETSRPAAPTAIPLPGQVPQDEPPAPPVAAEACDKGAAIPFDPRTIAAPVYQFQLEGQTLSAAGALRALVAACRVAAEASPDNPRVAYQLLRSRYFDGDRTPAVIEAARRFARDGVSDAHLLLFRHGTQTDDGTVTRSEALEHLKAAAGLGNLEAEYALIQAMLGRPRGVMPADPQEAYRRAAALAKGALAGNAPQRDAFMTELRDVMRHLVVSLPIEEEGFTDQERKAAFAAAKALQASGDPAGTLLVAKALRAGRGTEPNPAEARRVLQAAGGERKAEKVMLAEMLIKGEGGPADPKRALDLLRDPGTRTVLGRGPLLADLLMANTITGPLPREAIAALEHDILSDPAKLKLAALAEATRLRLERPAQLDRNLQRMIGEGNREAAFALARLLLSGHPQFDEPARVRPVLARYATQGDYEARILSVAAQYAKDSDFDLRRFQTPGAGPSRIGDGDVHAWIDEGVARNHPLALLLFGKLSRRGILYPQDDEAATAAFIKAAERGNIEAMLLAGEAYDDGKGIRKDKVQRLRWWRAAAKLGSIAAREKLANAFVFDSFDKLMTLREGVTEVIALYGNGQGYRFADRSLPGGIGNVFLSSLFRGGRFQDAGNRALAAAIMDGFRLAPAGLEEEKLVPLVKALDDEVRVEIERALAREGFLKRPSDGFFGPEAREALRAWTEAKGPLPDATLPGAPQIAKAAPQGTPGTDTPPGAGSPEVAVELVDAARERAFAVGNAAKSDRDKIAAIRMLNTLARYGDHQARWALMKNYHQSKLIRGVVSGEELMRYGIDILVSKPRGVEKAEFEMIFSLTSLFQQRKAAAGARAFFDALRDDARLQDALVLNGLLKQFAFAPGICDALLAEARKQGIRDAGGEGCEEQAGEAFIAFAKSKGPAGVEIAARKAAAPEVRKLAEAPTARR